MKVSNIKKSWSKYGNHDGKLLKIRTKWFCQACHECMPEAIDPFLMLFMANGITSEYLRVCPTCHSISKKKNLDYFDLIKQVRK